MPAQLTRLLLVLLLTLPVSALAHPALWVVKDADTTIYLFGTVHLLPKDTHWRYPALDEALARSQALMVETTDDDPAHMKALVLRYGLAPNQPLSQQLSPFYRGRLARAARIAHVPGGVATLDAMRPWLAAITLTVAPLRHAGMNPAQGVDRQLRALMKQAGKPVRALETAEEQVRYFADMPSTLQLALLRNTLRGNDHADAEFSVLLSAWQAGDVDAIARLENAELARSEPALYQRLLPERNAAWAQHIRTMLQQPGTSFLAVGAAHLAGPDSVQVQLEKLGLHVTRVPDQAPRQAVPSPPDLAPSGGYPRQKAATR